MKTLIAALFIAMLALPVLAQPIVRGKFAAPYGADLERFPIKAKPLTTTEQAELGLSAVRLEEPTVVANHFRNIRPNDRGRFVLETLPAGTLVLVDKSRELRYKADCGNRVSVVSNCLQCHTIAGGMLPESERKGLFVAHMPPAKQALAVSNTGAARPSLWQKLGNGWSAMTNSLKSAAKGLWNGIGSALALLGWLLLLLLGLAAIAAIIYSLYRLLRPMFNREEENGGQPAQPAQPQPAPPPPAPAPVVPAPVVPPPAPAAPQPAQAGAAPIPQNPPAPNPAPPAFPAGRAVIDFGGAGESIRVQAGAHITRVESDRNRADGSTMIRIFHA